MAIHAFALERRRDPIVDRSRHQANHLGRFGPFAQSQHSLRASSLLGWREAFDFLEHNLIQIEMVRQRRQIASLLADDLGCRVFDNARTMEAWLFLGSNKVLKRLSDLPDNRVSHSARAD